MKRNILAYGAVALLFVALGSYFGAKRLEPGSPATPAVANLLAQSLSDPQGQQKALSEWKGKALIVNFWAPWCAPCVQEMPELSALHAEIMPKDIHVIGIGIDTQAHISEFSAKYKISYPLYIAGMGGAELSRQFGNQSGGLPFTVLIGRDGQVKKTYLGTLKFEVLRADLAAL